MTSTRNSTAAPIKDPDTGRWSFILDLGPGPDAKGVWRQRRQARRRGFTTKHAALTEMTRLRAEADDGNYIVRTDETVGEWIEEWLVSVAARVKPSTVSFYKRKAAHIVPRIGSVKLRQLDSATLNRLYADLLVSGRKKGNGGLSVTTVRHVATLLGTSLDEAVRAGRLRVNPAKSASPPTSRSVDKPEMKTWNAAEVSEFLGLEHGSRYGPAWTFLALTGCRRGEALGLTWADVDLDNRQVSIRRTITAIDHEIHRSATTKTGKGRSISLQDDLVESIRSVHVAQARERLRLGVGYADEDLVFCQVDGRPHHPDYFSREWDRRVKRHGMKRIRLHDLRHTYATLALSAGVPAKVVADRLGHSSVMITLDLYSHVTPAVEADHANVVARLIFEPGAS